MLLHKKKQILKYTSSYHRCKKPRKGLFNGINILMQFKDVTLGGCSFGDVVGVPHPATTFQSDIRVYRDIPVTTPVPATATSGLGPVTNELIGTLPNGLTYNNDGTISGESTEVMSSVTMNIRFTDIFNQTSDQPFLFTSASSSGERVYSTPGTYTFTVPDNVFALSVVCVGAGGSGGASYATNTPVYTPGGGGGGGGLGYKNNITVTPGQTFQVVVGQGGASVKRTTANTIKNGNNGGDSSFGGTTVIGRGGAAGTGGTSTSAGTGGAGGTKIGDGGGNGGYGGSGNSTSILGGGGGGAAGYSGNGGNGATPTSTGTTGVAGSAGAGGGAGGGSSGIQFGSYRIGGASGGGVGIFGQGDSGTATEIPLESTQTVFGGIAGSSGTNGYNLVAVQNINYGSPSPGSIGGGGGGESITGTVGSGAGSNGAVRIMWQGTRRTFPTTRTSIE